MAHVQVQEMLGQQSALKIVKNAVIMVEKELISDPQQLVDSISCEKSL